MLLNALSFLAGIVLVQQLAELPAISILLSLLAVLVITLGLKLCRSRPVIYRLLLSLTLIVAGACWVTLYAHHYLEHKLPESLAGREFLVEGTVQGIPTTDGDVQRFELAVDRIEHDDSSINLPEHLRLSWYYGREVNAGERWQWLVRLKPPHGFFNPGGFDYEGWLYGQGIHATGYIRDSEKNLKLSDAGAFSIDALRQLISKDIQKRLGEAELSGLVTALAVGDRTPINNEHWDTLIRTGTNHLMAISGLHIGLAAAFGYWLVRRLVSAALMKYIPAQQVGMIGGLTLALIYALLAGLSIPTQRALIMLICFVGMLIFRRSSTSLNAMAVALLAVLLWDPVAVLSAGFWFSFLAVAVIFYVFSGRLQYHNGWRTRLQQWGWMQISISLALFPLSLLLFQQTSLVAPLANLILVPYVSFLVVPLVLLALLMLPLSTLLSGYLFIAANALLELIWPVINGLSLHPYAYWVQAVPGWPELLLALIGVALLLAPRGFPARWLGAVMILPVILNTSERPKHGDFAATMLDVGQGLSVVIRTQNHALVFDAGNRLGSQLDAGESVVLPYLRHWAVRRLDKLVISHGDADHIGGAQAVVDAYPGVVVVGQDIEPIDSDNKSVCQRGERWQRDGVEFEFLHPDEHVYSRRNNHACVLMVSAIGGRLLISSDIEDEIEKALVKTYGEQLRAEVMLVPHHGSKTSSSQAFIDTVEPKVALIPAGYRNRYHHPNNVVVARYQKAGATLYHSGHVGAVELAFTADQGAVVVDEYRRSHRKYWNHLIIE
ncbi:MAG: DNA internalization-related competence protein ComEC/Rec2 [Gammaproteobacteria bacterium]|nr:DNA internalization-related competence protein ComEC/Rec2 [Gammaproteobacteria bacterium]